MYVTRKENTYKLIYLGIIDSSFIQKTSNPSNLQFLLVM